MPAMPGGAGTQLGRENRISTKPKARSPKAHELSVLEQGLLRLRTQYAADPSAARELLSVGESKADQRLDAVEHAAWTGLCLGILNLDEAMTKE